MHVFLAGVPENGSKECQEGVNDKGRMEGGKDTTPHIYSAVVYENTIEVVIEVLTGPVS